MSLRRLARIPSLAVRQLRWKRGAWSKDSDRQYHDRLYDAQAYDPFAPDYPGYVTIRRFADHAAALIPTAGTILDLGCGPGEITCELARRYPHLSFIGIDHSERAIERARGNAARLGLNNVRFEAGDAEKTLPSGGRYGLVLMFDAFHHLEHPHEFLQWVKSRTTRCLLIEPAGTWTGGWSRGLDVDWLLLDLANIRDRLEATCGEPSVPVPDEEPAPSANAAPARGEGAIERRYAVEDFQRFFDSWSLRVTGTVAGFDRYPPRPHSRSALRPVAGEVAYALVCAVEELLLRRDSDGAAKHWVVAATSEPNLLHPRVPSTSFPQGPEAEGSTVSSRYKVTYGEADAPGSVHADSVFQVSVGVMNSGWAEWSSEGPHPVKLSYHWLTSGGQMSEFDGLRTPLAPPLAAKQSRRFSIKVQAPSKPGDYVLAIDLVQEGVTWFSEADAPWCQVHVSVNPKLANSHT